MPAGLQVSDYDIICVRPGEVRASAPLRSFVVPVNGNAIGTDAAANTGMRGVAARYPDGPNPITGKRPANCVNLATDYTGEQLGLVWSVATLQVMFINNLDNILPTPPSIIFQIRTGSGGTVTERFTGVFSPNVWEYRDTLIQVSGLNLTQLEIYARVDTAALPAPGRVEVGLAVNLRLNDDANDRVWVGPNVVAGGP